MALFHHYLLLAFRCSGPLFLVVPINKGPEIKSNSTANISQIELLNKVIRQDVWVPQNIACSKRRCAKVAFFAKFIIFMILFSPILLKY
ncbi:MAG: hypothetical protein JWP67_1446 [Mucilaginibacter sp.]|nr:hypothetical protein [Mucilaginibacter sp.]